MTRIMGSGGLDIMVRVHIPLTTYSLLHALLKGTPLYLVALTKSVTIHNLCLNLYVVPGIIIDEFFRD